MDMKPAENGVITTPVKPTESFNGGTVCTISPEDEAALVALCGGPHARREVEPYLSVASSPVFQVK